MAYQEFINAVPKRHRETVCNWVDTQIALGVRNANVLAQIARCIADELADASFHKNDHDEYWRIAELFDCDPDDAREFAAMRLRAFDPTQSTSRALVEAATNPT